jgi:hypothetical protein
MDVKIDLEEDTLEYVDVIEFIDRTTPDGGLNA